MRTNATRSFTLYGARRADAALLVEIRRIDAVCNKDLMLVVLGLRKSTFLEAAKKEWEDAGARKMSNVLNEWSSFEQEIPG